MKSEKSIGSIIREIRWEKKLSQKEMADSLGVSAISIHSYEHDKRKPGPKVYKALINLRPELESEILDTFRIPGSMTRVQEKDENKMDRNQLNLLTQSQKRIIELQDEKLLWQYEKIKSY